MQNFDVRNYKRISHVPVEGFAILLRNSRMMIGNSSTIVRETCLYGIPSINIGKRQLNRQHGRNVISLPDCSYDELQCAFEQFLKIGKFEPEYVYGVKGQLASEAILGVLITKI